MSPPDVAKNQTISPPVHAFRLGRERGLSRHSCRASTVGGRNIFPTRILKFEGCKSDTRTRLNERYVDLPETEPGSYPTLPFHNIAEAGSLPFETVVESCHQIPIGIKSTSAGVRVHYKSRFLRS